MSAVTTAARVDVAPGLGRLTKVELRKMTDTRAGFWVLLATVLITVAAVVIATLVGDALAQRFEQLLSVAVMPPAVLLPVVGVLLVTSEWSQRTSLITFTLVPRRGRVLAAKLLAGVILAVVALVVSLAASAVATLVAAPGLDDTWSLPLGIVGQHAVFLVTWMLIGVAFGAALLASAPAIVLFFGLPTVFSALGSIHALTGTADWTDTGRTLTPMTDELLSGTQWAQAGTTIGLWLLVPLAIGAWRVVRRDVS